MPARKTRKRNLSQTAAQAAVNTGKKVVKAAARTMGLDQFMDQFDSSKRPKRTRQIRAALKKAEAEAAKPKRTRKPRKPGGGGGQPPTPPKRNANKNSGASAS